MNNCEPVAARNISYMGYTVRTAAFRYTEWLEWDGARCVGVWAAAPAPGLVELYDHRGQAPFPLDLDRYENENVAADPALAAERAAHRALLRARFAQTGQVGCPPDVGPDGEALGVTGLESF